MSSKAKRKRKKNSNNKDNASPSNNVVETKFGVVFKTLNSSQKKAFNQFLFTSTDPNSNLEKDQFASLRKYPDYEVKDNHLWIKSLSLRKNTTTGQWEIDLVETNQGKFGTSTEQTMKIDQTLVNQLAIHLKQDILEEDLAAFIQMENQYDKNSSR